jgi:hypothetical protein
MQEKESKDVNRNHIILWFLNFDLSHEEITARLNLQPTRIATKGQEQITPNGVAKVSRHTFWEYEWKSESNECIGDAVERFVEEIIKPRTECIKSLAENVDAEFKIVQYYYDGCNPGYHFTTETMQTLIAANLEMDIDTYCLYEAEASR